MEEKTKNLITGNILSLAASSTTSYLLKKSLTRYDDNLYNSVTKSDTSVPVWIKSLLKPIIDTVLPRQGISVTGTLATGSAFLLLTPKEFRVSFLAGILAGVSFHYSEKKKQIDSEKQKQYLSEIEEKKRNEQSKTWKKQRSDSAKYIEKPKTTSEKELMEATTQEIGTDDVSLRNIYNYLIANSRLGYTLDKFIQIQRTNKRSLAEIYNIYKDTLYRAIPFDEVNKNRFGVDYTFKDIALGRINKNIGILPI